MIDIKLLREKPEIVRASLDARGSKIDLNAILEIENLRRQVLQKVEEARSMRNSLSDEIGRLKRAKQDALASSQMEEMKGVNERLKEHEELLRQYETQFNEAAMGIPNIIHSSVPRGRDEKDNAEKKRWGDIPHFSFEPLNHWDIGQKLGILDFDRATKIAGARFCISYGAGARLERALINFMLDLHTRQHGYREALVPVIVNDISMTSTGQLPKFAEDLFRLEGTRYYLIPTAEVPVTNLHRDEILDEDSLTLKYVAYTPCFRSEAGSYGKDTKGMIRQHQFNKVELVKFSLPENSYEELELLLQDAEEVLQLLKLPYRVVALCSGDLGFSSAKTYDIEVWLPGQNTYREISSCSNFEDFQARRAGIRYRAKKDNKVRLVHTLNGSGLAVGRTVVAILENYQQADGSVIVPEALRPYMDGMEKIQAA